jgi:O-6-methylguanine DNA methyltransferase
MSPFKEKVSEVVKNIPEGEVLSYGEVAMRASHPGAGRAVGSIMKANRDPAVPCHRVIRSDGSVGKYNKGDKEKISRLIKEGIYAEGGRITRRPSSGSR